MRARLCGNRDGKSIIARETESDENEIENDRNDEKRRRKKKKKSAREMRRRKLFIK